MRLRKLGAALAGAAVLLVSACSGSGGADDSTASASAGVGYPVTLDTKFGPVEVQQKPKRVVALGWGDAETALALGVQPVGASDWLAFGGEGVGPWAKGLYTKAPQIIETLEPSYEKIAALQPDLILDVKSSGDQKRYDRLQQIAPTIGVPKDGDSYLTPSDEQMRMIAAALGEKSKGESLLKKVDDSFADVAAKHPEWKGKTAVVATKTAETWAAYISKEGGGSDGRVDFLKRLGFVQNPKIAALEPDATGFSVSLSSEKVDLLDSDLVTAFPIGLTKDQLVRDPLFQKLPAVQKGHDVVVDGDLSSAFSLGTTLATTYALEKMTPLIEKATSR